MNDQQQMESICYPSSLTLRELLSFPGKSQSTRMCGLSFTECSSVNVWALFECSMSLSSASGLVYLGISSLSQNLSMEGEKTAFLLPFPEETPNLDVLPGLTSPTPTTLLPPRCLGPVSMLLSLSSFKGCQTTTPRVLLAPEEAGLPGSVLP